MARSASAKAEAAAEVLEAFLRHQPRTDRAASQEGAFSTCVAAAFPIAGPESVRPAARRGAPDPGEVPPAALPAAGTPLRLAHTDWLHHRLTVTGPAEAVAAFQEAASGAGTVPWQFDLASLEEDWFHRLVDPAHRSLSLQGARVLAAQLREAVERRHALAVARVGQSRACPFDLHALLPVPPGILTLGPDDPAALSWLCENWGTTEALRHVSVDTVDEVGRRGRAPPGAGWHLQFWSADWTPWRAISRIRTGWPALQVDVQPSYD